MKRILCWSGGADSTATVILAKEMGMKIDFIIFSEVMFDEETSCELPEHMDFIYNAAIPQFKKWGYETVVVRDPLTYMDFFNHVRVKGKNIGKTVGFPMADKCNVKICKIRPIRRFMKPYGEYMEYVSYCIDEPKRLQRLSKNKVSLLAMNEYTHKMSIEKCKEYGVLSPYYTFSKRGGCWCCPNASESQLYYLRENHKELWEKLIKLEKRENLIGYIFNTQTGCSVCDLDKKFRS